MSFYLISEGLTCLGMLSGAYESLKVLSRVEKGIDISVLRQILEFWLVLGSLRVFEEYLEFLVSWIPFFYLFKCMLLALVLMPNAKIPHVLYHGCIEPSLDHIQLVVHEHVTPLVEALILRHGQWFNTKLVSKAVGLMKDDELEAFEQELTQKLLQVREEQRSRRRRAL
ncbi:hypothetical protein P43SY_007268 [Pythium insidiosum]|uniref:Uncharacterized protein n=1 Tax=Pythium insidiosum TaxID=114742 RepID=A0AAD5L7B8_PYTIN|nr:hypothetical protein P43SY_007268 [Pythium insidiosum]